MIVFHVGQQVCCVDDNWDSAEDADGNSIPTTSRVPMIGEVLRITQKFHKYGQTYLRFAEIDHAWLGEMFRPVVERKTSIAIFTAMLTKTRISVPA